MHRTFFDAYKEVEARREQIPPPPNHRFGRGTLCSLFRILMVVRYKKDGKYYYIGGHTKGKISLHDIETGERVKRNIKVSNIEEMYIMKWRVRKLKQSGGKERTNSSPTKP